MISHMPEFLRCSTSTPQPIEFSYTVINNTGTLLSCEPISTHVTSKIIKNCKFLALLVHSKKVLGLIRSLGPFCVEVACCKSFYKKHLRTALISALCINKHIFLLGSLQSKASQWEVWRSYRSLTTPLCRTTDAVHAKLEGLDNPAIQVSRKPLLCNMLIKCFVVSFSCL